MSPSPLKNKEISSTGCCCARVTTTQSFKVDVLTIGIIIIIPDQQVNSSADKISSIS